MKKDKLRLEKPKAGDELGDYYVKGDIKQDSDSGDWDWKIYLRDMNKAEMAMRDKAEGWVQNGREISSWGNQVDDGAIDWHRKLGKRNRL